MKDSIKFLKPKNIGEVLFLIFTIIFFIFFLYFFLHALADNGAPYVDFSIDKVLLYGVVILLCLLIIFFLTGYVEQKTLGKLKKPLGIQSTDTNNIKSNSRRINQAINKKKVRLTKKTMINWIVGFVILFLLQIIYSKMFYTKIGWDCGTIVNMVIEMLNNNTASIGYLAQNPNNSALYMMLYHYLKICSVLGFKDLIFATVVFNIVFLDIAIALVIATAHKLWENKNTVVLTIVLSIMTIAFTPWIIVPYTDTLSMFYPILFFYLYLCINDQDKAINKKRKIILIVVLGALAYFGFKLKPSTIIILFAIGISILLSNKFTKKQFSVYGKNLMVMFCGVIIALLIFMCNKSILLDDYVGSTDYDNLEMPISNFVMIGLQKQMVGEDKALWGAFNSEDYFAISGIMGKSEKTKYANSVIRNRLNSFGFQGYLEFLTEKANFCFEDGTFFWGGEGGFFASAAPATTNHVATWVQSFIYNTSKQYGSIFCNVLQAIWMIILFLIVLGVIIAPSSYKNLSFTILRIAVFGLLLYLLLLEARSRYLIGYIPIFILLSVDGAVGIKNIVYSIKKSNNHTD